MNKTLIALINSHSRQAYADMQRSTWIPRIPEGLDYKFFRGRGATRGPLQDEVFLDCDDTYAGLPEKVQKAMIWSYDHGYEFTLKCDDDVILIPDRFLDSGYDFHDFVGNIIGDGGQNIVPWGFCWTLSRTAMRIVSEEPLPDNNNDEMWVAHTLLRHGIRLRSDERYRIHKVGEEGLVVPLTRPEGSPLPMFPTLLEGRPLRSPKREKVEIERKVADPRIFAYCMFFRHVGNVAERLPDEMNITEMRKVWERVR